MCTYLLIYFTQPEYEDEPAKLELDAEPEVGGVRLGGEHARPTAGATYGTGAGVCLTPLRDTFDMTTTCIGSTTPGAEPGIRGGEAGDGVGNDMFVASTEHIPQTATAPMPYPFLDNNRGRNAPRTKPDLRTGSARFDKSSTVTRYCYILLHVRCACLRCCSS